MSNKKFFSHGLEQSAIDVIYKKKGHELLRYYNQSIHGSFMKSFPSYEQFILLLRTFYFSPQVKPYNIQVPLSLRNANSTFILYNNIKTHVSSCSSCQENPVVLLNRCEVLKQILYPYGLYISDDLNLTDFHMHNGLNLRDYCVKCPDIFLNNHHDDGEEDTNKKKKEENKTIHYDSSLFLQEKTNLYKRCDTSAKLCGSTSTSNIKINSKLFVGPFRFIDRKTLPVIKEKGGERERDQRKKDSTCCG